MVRSAPASPRRASAERASVLVGRLRSALPSDRERVIEREILAGNVPSHLRQLTPISVAATIQGRLRVLTYWVTPDYLAIGSDPDFLRVPMRASTAQRIADRFGCMLPTRKIVEDVHRAAVVTLTPRPFHPDEHDITSLDVFVASQRAIDAERAGRAGLVSGAKKDIVISSLIDRRPGRIAIYGWHRRSGEPIQPLAATHSDAHVDYSHGVRLVLRKARLDGEERDLAVLLADPDLWPLVSDEGPIGSWRYPSGS